MPVPMNEADAAPADPPLAAVERRMEVLLGEPAGSLAPVPRAARAHVGAGGRRLRARLGLAAGAALDLDPEVSVALAATAELLHNASLVHDDLQDGDETRRGARSVWAAYGADVAICTGDMLLSAGYAAATPVVAAAGPGALERVHSAVAETIHGQTADRRAADAPLADFAGYRRMARAKSGPLIALPLELAVDAAGRPGALARAAEAGRAFALAYQIADDLADVSADEPGQGANVVHLLARTEALPPAEGRRAAAARARHALYGARAAAAALPAGAGRPLIAAADALAARLTGE
jgi:geranylgeranyl diphosphate synthase type II